MTKKSMALIAVLPITMILGTLAVLPARPGVTKANFHRIQEGMTRAEVEETFGTRGVKFTTLNGLEFVRWVGDDGSSVNFVFENDSVTWKNWRTRSETMPDKIRRWLYLAVR